MQFSSNSLPVIKQDPCLPKDYPARCQTYVQQYNPSHSLHYHGCMEIGLCTEGNGAEMIGNQLYSFSSNHISVIQANCIHDSRIPMHIDDQGSSWKFIFVNPEQLGLSCDYFGGYLTNNPDLISLFHLMYYELDNKPHNYQFVFKSLLACFLVYAKRTVPPNIYISNKTMSDQMLDIIHRINTSYNEPFSISKLAEEYNMSISKLNRMFKSFLGLSPLTYIHNVRLTMAEHLLLNTNLPIISIASSVGFDSLSSFNRTFKQKYNMNPRALRQKNKPVRTANENPPSDYLV